MSRRFRTFLFIFFVTLFTITAPSLVLYAQGYRINWPIVPGQKLIVMTGGFFVRTTPKQADIYVNGKLNDQTDFFFASALLENFLPRQYQIEAKKTGFQTWQKNLEIKEGEVTEVRNITLFPERLQIAAVEKNAAEALLSPDKQKIALRGQDENGWNLKLYDISKGVTSKLAGEKDFSAKGAAFSDWTWENDSKKIDVSAVLDNATTSYTISIEKNPARLEKKPALNATTTEGITIYAARGNNYSIDPNGFIMEKGATGNASKVSPAQIAIEPEAKYRLWVFKGYYFVAKNSELYILKSGSDSFEKIFDGLTSDLAISPDGKKVVYASDSEIWLFFLGDKTDQPQFASGSNLFVARLSEKISNCDWFNSDYLIFIAGGAVKTAEIDNRDKINIVDLIKLSSLDGSADIQKAKLFWDSKQKSAFLFLGNALYKSQSID